MPIIYILLFVLALGFVGYSANGLKHYTAKKDMTGQLATVLCIVLGLYGGYFFGSKFFRNISAPISATAVQPKSDKHQRPMPALAKIEADMASMPARSLIFMKDEKFLLASRISTDDRPYTLDVLDSPGGKWTRVEFDEAKRREIVGIAYPNQSMLYETQAALFLRQ